jgi:signal peptidase I
MTKQAAIWVSAIVAVAAVAAGLMAASGLRFYTVMTPSMGTVAPVGTLVATRPAETYRVGDIVTYERNNRSYTHRIIQVNPDGTFVTKGDLNGAADPLAVAPDQVVGRAVLLAPGFGWLWQGLPWLTLGGILVYAVSLLRRFDHTWRWVLRISGWTLVFCLVAFWLHPWVSLTQLTYVASDGGGVDMHVVNTGLFPLDVLGHRLTSGQDATVHVTQQNADGYYTLTPNLGFHWWEQVGIFLLCLIPMGLSFLIRTDPVEPARAIVEEPDGPDESEQPTEDEPEPGEQPTGDEALATELLGEHPDRNGPDETEPHQRRHLILIVALVLALIISVAVVTFATTSSALTAKVTNSANTAGTRMFFSCTNAMSSTSSPVPYLAWALNSTGNQTDLSGNGRTGAFTSSPAPTLTTSAPVAGCRRDTAASIVFPGTTANGLCLYTAANYSTAIANKNVFSLEAWFRTAKTGGNGKIIGYGANRNAANDSAVASYNFDRHIYLDAAGRIVFGVNPGTHLVTSGTGYNDNAWHHVVATLSTAGQFLYVDGALVDSDTTVTAGENLSGYWKVGCGGISTWPNGDGSTYSSSQMYFNGSIQFAAVYPSALTAAQVTQHYLAGAS